MRTMMLCTLLGATAAALGACQSPSKPEHGQSADSSGEFQYGPLGAHRTMGDASAQRRAKRAAQDARQDQTEAEAEAAATSD